MGLRQDVGGVCNLAEILRLSNEIFHILAPKAIGLRLVFKSRRLTNSDKGIDLCEIPMGRDDSRTDLALGDIHKYLNGRRIGREWKPHLNEF